MDGQMDGARKRGEGREGREGGGGELRMYK